MKRNDTREEINKNSFLWKIHEQIYTQSNYQRQKTLSRIIYIRFPLRWRTHIQLPKIDQYWFFIWFTLKFSNLLISWTHILILFVYSTHSIKLLSWINRKLFIILSCNWTRLQQMLIKRFNKLIIEQRKQFEWLCLGDARPQSVKFAITMNRL